jgi:hypothetical protein
VSASEDEMHAYPLEKWPSSWRDGFELSSLMFLSFRVSAPSVESSLFLGEG